MNNEILYYLIIFGSVILAGALMIAIGIFSLRTKKKV